MPGGGLEENETVDQCLLRELKEEMHFSPSQIVIDREIIVMEHIFQDNGIQYHEINLVKNVFLSTNQIQSYEGHILFEKVDLCDLNKYDIRPRKIKDYLIQKYVIS